ENVLKQIKEEKIKKENILKITDNFISDNEKFLKVNPANLKLKKFDSDRDNYYVTYQQYYEDIPVYRGLVGLTINKYEKILIMGSDFQQEINISATPKILKGDAIRIVKEDINFNDEEDEIKEISLMIIQKDDAEYTLAWNVFVITKSPVGDWIFFIDAFSGKIIKKHNNLMFEYVNGTISGMIYPKRYDNVQQEKNFSYEIIKTNITLKSSAFYSGIGAEGDFYDSNMTTKFPINLSNATHANLTFLTQYYIEPGWDFAYIEISNDSGNSWKQLKGKHTSIYSNPMVYARGWINNSFAYTGNSFIVLKENIDISNYTNGEIFLRFRYTCDKYEFKDGFYVDNISVITDSGVAFFDDAENDNEKWNLSKFKVVNKSFSHIYGATDKNGYYEISGIENNTNIHSELMGFYVDVDNDKQNDTFYDFLWDGNETHNWNWTNYDTSYKQEESNIYYHINKIHDFFAEFNFSELDYPLKVVVEANDIKCNAYYSPGMDRIAFSGPWQNCENPALGSDIIYHEYTHAVVDHIYDLGKNSDIIEDAMHEAFADYFACTLNNDSIVADGWSFARNLNNTRKYPENLSNSDSHISGLILGGALWDVRKNLNNTLTDSLIFNAIRITPHAYNFSEFLDNLLIADDDNANIEDGTPNRKVICNMFFKHGIYSAAGLCENALINCDSDNDGFNATDETSEGICDGNDCNDNNTSINPNTVWFYDADNDTYGNATNYILNCTKPSGNYILYGLGLDCDDFNVSITHECCTKFDFDNNATVDIFDVVATLEYLSEGKQIYNSICSEANGNGRINLIDVFALIDKIVTNV
ncbi:MAG: immune inhibitor A, partial [Candidatus Altarchaeum sp.]|nr:immune inhibitor A [Candidatus Altarchaeum sp.]